MIKQSIRIKVVTILFGFLTLVIRSQELPPINIYSPEDYQAENQNWAITQSDDKYIYVANNQGLLEFNGSKWNLNKSPNETIMRSVLAVNDRIYSGCYMEFGFWKRNNLGLLIYTSLSQQIEFPLIEDEQFWNIISLDKWVLFQSLNRIYIYDTDTDHFKIIESDTSITHMYLVNNSIYFQRINDGLYKLENGESVLVSIDKVVKQNVIVNVFDKNGVLMVQTQDNGIYEIEGSELKTSNYLNELNISNPSVYSSLILKDGSYMLGTISDGIFHLDESGNIVNRIDQKNGLSDNTVLSLFEDSDYNIWLGLDNGINCINMKSPFKIFSNNEGNIGSIYTSALHQGKLYVGTNQGLFYKNFDKHEPFKFVEQTQGQVWCLVKFENTLFCGNNFGTFVIENNVAQKVSDIQGTWNIKQIPGKSNLLIQGNYNGISVLEKVNNGWQLKNKIDGFDISSRFLEFIDDNEIFVSHEYKGIFKIKLNSDFTEALIANKDTIHKGLNSTLTRYNDEILYSYKEGVFKYNVNDDQFQKDSIFSMNFNHDNYLSGKMVSDEKHGRLWTFTNASIDYFLPGKLTTTATIHKIPIPQSLRNGVTSYENILHLDDQRYLFGTTSGFIIMDLEQLIEKSYNIDLNTIKISSIKNNSSLLDKSNTDVISYKRNNIEFSFCVPEFDMYLETKYQYRLEGLYDEWSDWSGSSSELFKNLSHGRYVFDVRAKVGETLSKNTTSFTFIIGRPWYLSNSLITVYVLILFIIGFITHNAYKRYYRIQREKLLYRSNKELELKKLENEQQLMRYKNESLVQDINSKNRELAISTMSLIKKNEFLNSIKEELKNSNHDNRLNRVIKIINSNLNNTDDWKMFEEAFNNADKDFLKKVKDKHDALTSNDLRLCAYLRLNLSSKEIAPLLNISPRSVEVKRYRLRKKMNLPHETSLTNYILEL